MKVTCDTIQMRMQSNKDRFRRLLILTVLMIDIYDRYLMKNSNDTYMCLGSDPAEENQIILKKIYRQKYNYIFKKLTYIYMYIYIHI